MSANLLPALAVLAACASAPGVRAPAGAEAVLRQRTQALLDAVTAGDAKVWDRYLDPRVVYRSTPRSSIRARKRDR